MASSPHRRPAPGLRGAQNFRDLGGYRTTDGKVTRFGRVFRSNSLQELTPDDLQAVRERLKLATVLDLRGSNEVARDGRGPLDQEPLRYVNIPLLQEKTDYQPGDVETGLVDRYLGYLEFTPDNVVRALETIAEEGAQPLVFHCSAGKDRTGVIAALLLSCLGVDAETVVADYAAKDVDRDLLEFLRRRPSYAKRLAKLPSSALRSEPATMREFLRIVEHRYGGARAWASAAGLDERALRRLDETLLGPAQT